MIIVSNYTRYESLDMAHQCVAKEVMKTTFAINFTGGNGQTIFGELLIDFYQMVTAITWHVCHWR
jgi:hypothetical protein